MIANPKTKIKWGLFKNNKLNDGVNGPLNKANKLLNSFGGNNCVYYLARKRGQVWISM